MDTGPGLIERAAALLKEKGSRTGPRRFEAEPRPVDAASPPISERAELLKPRTRTCILDYVALGEAGLVMPWLTSSRVVEEFRIVKHHLIATWKSIGYPLPSGGSSRIVMVTSAKPREGKTFCSLNLALTFAAEENLTVILIDADPTRAGVGQYLKIPAVPGLTTVLSGEASVTDALVQTDVTNLLVLPSGAPGPQIAELLTGAGASRVFAELIRRYPEHVIVVDTPPVLASTTPAGLSPTVAQIVFVLEAGHTQRAEIEAAVNLLSGCQHISFLLNKAPPSSGHFGSYSYYGKPYGASVKAITD
jgi:protein-tyrosine kinase